MMQGSHIRIGARGSKLSRRQAESVQKRVRATNPDITCEIVIIETTGDRTLDRPLPEIGSKGLFTLEIEDALRAGEIDLAVHSLKDLPTDPVPGIVIGAISERVAVTDSLISRSGAGLLDLPEGATVGTSSHRRAAQLRRARPDLRIESIRGNIDTRIRKTIDPDGPYDASVLATAGLERLGLRGEATEELVLELMLPAPGQGALAVQCRTDDDSLPLVDSIDDRAARLATSAERAFLAGLGGGCSAPIACYGRLNGNRLHLHGRLVSLDGTNQVDVISEDDVQREADAIELGTKLASDALDRGAHVILQAGVT
ncbi:MAG: hydroxymethylbilane synthase [Thermomicrobiales bacterium]|nr:hydroxymethylbilane synthase [Thermomicrobiales bacterium]